MKNFHFAETYFRCKRIEYPESKIRVIVTEQPSMEIVKESYSLRVETWHQDVGMVNRDFAIEHHREQDRHKEPHIQFKFHTEGVAEFSINLEIADGKEYQMAILGFIYKMKIALGHLEVYKPGITGSPIVFHTSPPQPCSNALHTW